MMQQRGGGEEDIGRRDERKVPGHDGNEQCYGGWWAVLNKMCNSV